MFKTPESLSKQEFETGKVLAPKFDANGLITAVVQDASNGEILMLAHMNEEALAKTLETGKAHFWSRSRQKLWLKGETSGNVLVVTDVRVDCDQDAVIVVANLDGEGACHTGARTCFFRSVRQENGTFMLYTDDTTT